MVDTVRQIRDQGVSILMIEHVMHAIMNVSEHILVLDYGELIAEGSPTEIANNEIVIEAYLGDPKMAEELMKRAHQVGVDDGDS
jgi:branched-chain amino acid transport system ATP-binding protein